jgi:hypothetical protein
MKSFRDLASDPGTSRGGLVRGYSRSVIYGDLREYSKFLSPLFMTPFRPAFV